MRITSTSAWATAVRLKREEDEVTDELETGFVETEEEELQDSEEAEEDETIILTDEGPEEPATTAEATELRPSARIVASDVAGAGEAARPDAARVAAAPACRPRICPSSANC